MASSISISKVSRNSLQTYIYDLPLADVWRRKMGMRQNILTFVICQSYGKKMLLTNQKEEERKHSELSVNR